MALADEVKLRYRDQAIVDLTGSGAADTAVIEAQLTRACTAVEDVYFPTYVGVAYNSALPVDGQKHIEVAVDGVVARLRLWANPKSNTAHERWASWIEQAKDAARAFGGRKRVTPVTTSTTVHETIDPARPPFGDSQFEDIEPEAPSTDEV